MDGSLSDTLTSLGATAFRWSALLFVLVNGGAALAIWMTRSRGLVNRITPKLLIANLLLLGTGVGVPILSQAISAVVHAVTFSSNSQIDLKSK